MKNSFNLVKYAREVAGITQGELGERSGLPVSSISFFENGRRIPRIDTAFRILSAVGLKQVAVSTFGITAAEASSSIREFLEKGNYRNAYRVLVQFSDDLKAEKAANKYQLIISEPATTGSLAWDCALAGLVDYTLPNSYPRPEWVAKVELRGGNSQELLFVGPGSKDSSITYLNAEAFRKRGVLLDTRDLASA